ncbi:PorT family protein [Flammeovirgaceae bacterium KN852]|uniref:PorT family protein n=2 Tax=Marinigracilibium pacificum TaxID=2729599 RepID=A0A848IUL3_9BACT|nr:PorT family protein [Marinigracilibium pacificum]
MIRLTFFAVCIILLSNCTVLAQGKYKNRSQQRQSQWWIGLKGGVNLTKASPDQEFSIMSRVSGDPDLTALKNYDNYGNFNGQFGVVFTYDSPFGLALSFQPTVQNYTFSYSYDFDWVDDTNTGNTLDINYQHDHFLRYFELPLFIRYQLPLGQTNVKGAIGGVAGKREFIPYIQGGFYYSKLIDAFKTISTTGVDNVTGNSGEIQYSEESFGVKNQLLKGSIGWIAGVGAAYDIGNVRISAEINYKNGLNNIASSQNRFANTDSATGYYDVFDDFTLKHIEFNLNLLFPLKFITSDSFNAL